MMMIIISADKLRHLISVTYSAEKFD